nr:MAG TPA: hypothetical protein [Caudoviricetes sp.]
MRICRASSINIMRNHRSVVVVRRILNGRISHCSSSIIHMEILSTKGDSLSSTFPIKEHQARQNDAM